MEDDASSSNLHNPHSGWHKNVTVTSSPISPCNPLADWCGAEYDAYKVVIDVYVVLAVCAVGFVGNALTVAVLRRDNDPTNTTNWLLQSLAFTDTLYLLSALVIQVRLYDVIVSYYITRPIGVITSDTVLTGSQSDKREHYRDSSKSLTLATTHSRAALLGYSVNSTDVRSVARVAHHGGPLPSRVPA